MFQEGRGKLPSLTQQFSPVGSGSSGDGPVASERKPEIKQKNGGFKDNETIPIF